MTSEAAWSDPTSLIHVLGLGPMDPPDRSGPLDRNPQLMQSTEASDRAVDSATMANIAYHMANGLDWAGWTSQTALSYVPGGTAPANTLGVLRGAAEGFGKQYAESGSFVRGLGAGASRAGWSAIGSAITLRALPGGGVPENAKTILQQMQREGQSKAAQVFVKTLAGGAVTLQQAVSSSATDAGDATTSKWAATQTQKAASLIGVK